MRLIRLKAGVKWREQVEWSTKWFLNMFKFRTPLNTISGLRSGTEGIVTRSNNIVTIVREFYKSLYSAVAHQEIPQEEWQGFFAQSPRIDTEACNLLKRPILLAVLKETLKSYRDSAPGLDGIPYSYYREYGDILLPLLLES